MKYYMICMKNIYIYNIYQAYIFFICMHVSLSWFSADNLNIGALIQENSFVN